MSFKNVPANAMPYIIGWGHLQTGTSENKNTVQSEMSLKRAE
jgi:hypothetical protein